MLREFFAYYRPHRALFLVDFGCAVLSGLLELGFPMAVKAFVDLLLPRGDWPLILLAGLALLVVYAINSGLMAIVTYWGHRLGINIETEMRRRAFDHLQKLSFRFYDEQKTGHLVARVTKDLEEIGEVAHHGPEDLFIAIMTFIGAFLLMLYVHPQLALITALIVPLAGFVVARYGALMAQNWRRQFGRVGAFNARLEENIGGMRVVQAFANEAHERALFAGDNQRYRTTKLEAYRIMAASQAINYLGMRMVQLAVMLAGTYYVVQGSLSVGGFVGFLLLVGVFYRPLDKIANVIETYPKGIAGFQRYQELLATEPDIADVPDAIEAPPLKGDIRFEGVGFGYAKERPVLSGIDLSVAAGETVAFVGPSGAGKTTLLSLLPRFYEVDAGRITVDGHDIRALTLASLRRQIGIVQQDVFLFAGTIRENIAYGRLDASEAEITEAARRARLETMIADLPAGLDTVIGERGVKLSGGQKQRLAIARAWALRPELLFLDEPTSQLDPAATRQIETLLTGLVAEGITVMMSTHDLGQARRLASRVLFLHRGRLVEDACATDFFAAPATSEARAFLAGDLIW